MLMQMKPRIDENQRYLVNTRQEVSIIGHLGQHHEIQGN